MISEKAKGLTGIFQRFSNHAKEHPYLTAFKAAGMTLSVASLLAVPVLGVVGFASAGPVAGSVAAAWQSSIGVVQAGSLFAWCQSAAMGGAALGVIEMAGVAGFAGAAGATLASVSNVPGLEEIFKRFYRRATENAL